MPFLDPALLLLGKLAEHFAQILPQLPVQRLPPALRDEDDVVFALPFCGLSSRRPSYLPFVCLAAHDSEVSYGGQPSEMCLPSPTFLNQALAIALWGAFAAVAALATTRRAAAAPRAARCVVAARRARRCCCCRCCGPGGRAPCRRGWRCRPSACCWPRRCCCSVAPPPRASAQARAAVRAVLHRLGRRGRVERRHRHRPGVRARLARRRLDRALRPGRPRGRQPAPAQSLEQPAAVVGHRHRAAARSWGACGAAWAGRCLH